MPKFLAGDSVRFKQGGLLMKVTEVREEDGETKYFCRFTLDGKENGGVFRGEDLGRPIGLDLVRGEDRIFVSLLWWSRAQTLASMNGWRTQGARRTDSGRIGSYILSGNTVLEEDARNLSSAITSALPMIEGGEGYLDRIDAARQNAAGKPNVEMLMPDPPEDPIEFFQGDAGRAIIEAIASFSALGEFSIEASTQTIG